MYLFIVPGFLYFVVFRYLPLLGNVVAFENYSPFLGFLDSPWVGLQNFADLFSNPAVGTALLNTVIINGLQIVFFFPAPIALALLLNSIMSPTVKRVIQSIVYLPYFIGWVVLVSIKGWDRYGLKAWIEAAKKRLHHNVLAIALANKLARIAWAVLNKERAFESVKTRPTASQPA